MKYRLEWKYKMKGQPSVLFSSEWINGQQILPLGEDILKTGRVDQLTFYDELGMEWTKKELEKLLIKINSEPHDVTVYFDGGFNKETYEAGIGVVVLYEQNNKKYRIRANELFSEIDTNNEAEYAALFFALQIIEDLGVAHLPCKIKGDAQGVLKQLAGEWPCYEKTLNKWLDRIEAKVNKLKIKPIYLPISRKANKEADKLASQALEGIEIFSKLQIE